MNFKTSTVTCHSTEYVEATMQTNVIADTYDQGSAFEMNNGGSTIHATFDTNTFKNCYIANKGSV